MKGSSFYQLPKVLQWFSGNIGFHHIHHLSPRIPNYNLERCHRAQPLFQIVKPVTFFASFKSLTFRLWDEQRRNWSGLRAFIAFADIPNFSFLQVPALKTSQDSAGLPGEVHNCQVELSRLRRRGDLKSTRILAGNEEVAVTAPGELLILLIASDAVK